MNALRTVVVSLSVCVLAACAGHQTKSASLAPAASAEADSASLSRHRVDAMSRDSAYVSAVERLALRRGIEVKWVNPPDRRKLADTQQLSR